MAYRVPQYRPTLRNRPHRSNSKAFIDDTGQQYTDVAGECWAAMPKTRFTKYSFASPLQ